MLPVVKGTDSVNLASASRKSFRPESATNIIACHDTAGVNLVEDETLSPVDFLVPRHFQERARRIRASRFPAGADALGTEVDIFRMVFAGKRRCQTPHKMHPGHAAVCRDRRYVGIGLGLGRKLLSKFPDNMTELVDLLLTADVAHRPARILQILLAAHYLPDAIRLRTVWSPHMHREDQTAATRDIVKHSFDRGIGENSSVPVKFAVNPDRGKAGGRAPEAIICLIDNVVSRLSK